MKRSALIFLFFLSYTNINSQPVQFGIGYGGSYFYKHLDNLEVYALEFNTLLHPYYSNPLEISHFSHGPNAEFVLGSGGTGMLVTWMERHSKYNAGGTNPSSGQKEEFELKTKVRRTGIGFKYILGRIGLGGSVDIGRMHIQYREDTGSGMGEWVKLFDNNKRLHVGATVFTEFYFAGRFGVKAYWMINSIPPDFGVIENYRFQISNVGIDITLYVAQNKGAK